jgi:hypothetical protein
MHQPGKILSVVNATDSQNALVKLAEGMLLAGKTQGNRVRNIQEPAEIEKNIRELCFYRCLILCYVNMYYNFFKISKCGG